MRVDVMSKMRGVDSFSKLWRRRTTIELPDGTKCDLLSLPDLVQAKKTQRDKDWPMIRRRTRHRRGRGAEERDGSEVEGIGVACQAPLYEPSTRKAELHEAH